MKSVVIYFSLFGNTHQVAEKIGQVLQQAGPAQVLFAGDLRAADLEAAELVIMGSPTHKMNLPERVRLILQQLPRCILKGKNVAAFDTSYEMNSLLARFTASKKLDRKLRRLGGQQIIEPETFHVVGKEGPLVSGALERAESWAHQILAQTVALVR